jgi:hypothetical protein
MIHHILVVNFFLTFVPNISWLKCVLFLFHSQQTKSKKYIYFIFWNKVKNEPLKPNWFYARWDPWSVTVLPWKRLNFMLIFWFIGACAILKLLFFSVQVFPSPCKALYSSSNAWIAYLKMTVLGHRCLRTIAHNKLVLLCLLVVGFLPKLILPEFRPEFRSKLISTLDNIIGQTYWK